MGSLMSRAAASTAPRTLTAAPRADEAARLAVSAAKAKFPPTPAVPGLGAPPSADGASEMHANRGIVEMLAKSSILTQMSGRATGEASAAAAEEADDDAPSGLKQEDLMSAIVLHAKDPQSWTAAALAQKFDVADVASLASALEAVRPYRVEEDELGRARGVPLEPAGGDAADDGSTGEDEPWRAAFDAAASAGKSN